ncbi:DNA topoisomerase VI subunit B [Halolamina pelagica]|uniref:DNA topoisomerase VI subunit B n=1 Tax=Halolamina pelagica TaxID=699431 RepID=A0A0P7HWJ7_9EURY|nr:DNA topoisomerase VI subunit B [Halolamina pelagica]
MARIMNNVGVDRERDGETVTLKVANHSDRNESLEITEIVSAEPDGLPDAVDPIEMDGEWFLNWNPEVSSGETVELEYSLPTDADADATVDGVDDEKLTVNA